MLQIKIAGKADGQDRARSRGCAAQGWGDASTLDGEVGAGSAGTACSAQGRGELAQPEQGTGG